MNNKIFYPLLAVLLILPFVLIAWLWDAVPDTIPVHYNIAMEPDRWADKTIGLFIIPIVTLLAVGLMLLAPKLDPKRKIANYASVYRGVILATALFMTGIFSMEILRNTGHNVPHNYLRLAMVVFFTFIGNVMLKLKPNYFFGIRTPWTMRNEEVWRRTHRLGGYIWVFASLLMLPIILFTTSEVYAKVFFGYVILIAAVPCIYSGIIYFKLKRQNT